MICDLLAMRPISHITKKTLSYLHSTKIEQMTKTMVIFKRGAIFLCCIRCDPIPPQTSVQRLAHTRNVTTCCFTQYVKVHYKLINYCYYYYSLLLSQNKATSSQVHLIQLIQSRTQLRFANLLEKQTSKNIYFFINPCKHYHQLGTLESYKQNEKQIYKPTLKFSFNQLCCCFTECLKSSLNFILCIEINKQPTSEDTSFPGLFFTKSEGKQQVCYLKSSATSFYDNANKNSLNSNHAMLLV